MKEKEIARRKAANRALPDCLGDISTEGVGERCVGGREGEVERVWGETRGNSPGSWKVKSCKILLLSAFYILFHGLKLPFSGIRILTEMDDPSVATADLPGSLEAQERKKHPPCKHCGRTNHPSEKCWHKKRES